MSFQTQNIANKVIERAERFKTRTIRVGELELGGNLPLIVQSMTTTDTKDVEATVRQVKDLADAG